MFEEVAVIGLGYVGLPLALALEEAGLRVVGIDKDDQVIKSLSAGRTRVDDFESAEIVAAVNRNLKLSTNFESIRKADAVIICVPTPLAPGKKPDLSFLNSAISEVVTNIHSGALVILESTSYPGTTEDLLVPLLRQKGLVPGEDVFVAYSPERIDPGNLRFNVKNTPRVVGGITETCSELAKSLYELIVPSVTVVSGPREAELTKLLENTYRQVNIALINEFARVAKVLDIDIWEVIDAASTKPYGFEAFYPGPGVGGHCIPIDPHYLNQAVIEKLGSPMLFIELATRINGDMPAYVVERLVSEAKLSRGDSVLILGVSYKAGVSDTRESPSQDVAWHLRQRGLSVEYFDPFVPKWALSDGFVQSCVPDPVESAKTADAVLLLQNHPQVDLSSIVDASSFFFDTRGVPNIGSVNRL